MNATGLMKLADFIENLTVKRFDMSTYNFCFLGFNATMLKWPTIDMVNSKRFAEHYELPIDQARNLCWGPGDGTHLKHISREQGVRTLRHFAATGTVDFKIGAPSQ